MFSLFPTSNMASSHLTRSLRVWGSVVRPAFANGSQQARLMGGYSSWQAGPNPEDIQPHKILIGKREIVGYGQAGEEVYVDDSASPFPAIRFQEDEGAIANLREKEKGDWKKLTIAEKKSLYRASFCQTFAEMDAPTGDWKLQFSILFAGVATGLMGYLWLQKFVYGPLPETITNDELVKAQIRRMLDMQVNPVEGFTSTYDQDTKRWKK